MTTSIQEPVPMTPEGAGAPAPAAQTQPQLPKLPRIALIPALLCAGLLYLSYFPVSFGWLGWVALVPLLVLVRVEASKKRTFFCALLAGLFFFVPVLQWMRYADAMMYFTWIALAIYSALYFPIGIAFIRVLDRRTPIPLIVSVPVVWTALEYFRGQFLTGWAWYFLSHTQHDFLPAIQIADLGGAWAVTFVVAAVNAWLFELLCTRRWFTRLWPLPEKTLSRRTLILQSACVLGLLVGVLGYGVWQLTHAVFEKGPVLALVQSNLDQGVRNEAHEKDDAAKEMIEQNMKLSQMAMFPEHAYFFSSRPEPPSDIPDLIVWPETSHPDGLIDYTADVEPQLAANNRQAFNPHLESVWREMHRPMLIGVNSEVVSPDARVRRYNSAIQIGEKGTFGKRYDKMHRVLFGEYIPFRESLPFMKWFSPYDFDYSISPGETFTRFPIQKYNFGVLICYEDSDPDLARQYVRTDANQPKVDFLINISNDGWFHGSCEHEQHLAVSRFRAVECRRALARAVNMGISGMIDGNGRIVRPESGAVLLPSGRWVHWRSPWAKINFADPPASRIGVSPNPPPELLSKLMGFLGVEPGIPDLTLSEWSAFKSVPMVLRMAVPIDHRHSYYAQFGDWLPIGCWVFIGLGLVWARLRRARPA